MLDLPKMDCFLKDAVRLLVHPTFIGTLKCSPETETSGQDRAVGRHKPGLNQTSLKKALSGVPIVAQWKRI